VKVTNCKVIPAEACLLQHLLVCRDLRVEGMKSNRREKGEKKIKQWELREETVRRTFEENVRIRMEGNNSLWEKLSNNNAGREIYVEMTGRFNRRREAWRWYETVQQINKEIRKHIRSGKKE